MPTNTLQAYHNLTLNEKLDSLKFASMGIRNEVQKPFAERVVAPLMRGNITIAEALASIPFVPLQKEQFYYDDPEDKEGIEKTFTKYLSKYGIKEPDKFAKELTQLSPEEAYKAVAKRGSKIFAQRLRDEVFTKRASELLGGIKGAEEKFYTTPIGKATIGTSPLFLMKSIEDSFAKSMGKENFAQFLRDSEHFVKIDYEDMGHDNAIWMGFVESLPIANKLIKWEGSGLNKFNESSSYYMVKGLGALTGTILQLMLMRKATRPFAQAGLKTFSEQMGIKTALKMGANWDWNTDRMAKVATKISNILMGGLDYGLNYSALTGLQIGLNNYIEEKHFDAKDLSHIMRSFELGSAIGGISAAWFGTQVPFIIQKPIEELEQGVVAAMSTMQSMYEDSGDITYEDFTQAFLWELIEIPFENFLPLALGLFGSTPMSGSLARMGDLETEVLKARTEMVKQENFGMTDSYARKLADGKIAEEMQRFQDENHRPMTFIEKRRYWKNTLENVRKQESKDIYEVTSKEAKVGDDFNPRNPYGENIFKDKDIRLLRWAFREKYPNEIPTEERTRSLFESVVKMSDKDIFAGYKKMSWEDQNFSVKQATKILANGDFYGDDFADSKKIDVMKKKLTEIGRIYPDVLKGKIKRKSKKKVWKFKKGKTEGRVDVFDEETGEVIGTVDPDPIITEYAHKWQEEAYGYRFGLDLLYDKEVDYIMNDILEEEAIHKTFVELIKKDPEINPDELASRAVDNIKGRPFYFARLGDKVFGKYMKLRDAVNIDMRRGSDNVHKDMDNIINRRLGRRITHHEDFWKNLRWSIGGNPENKLLSLEETLNLMAKDNIRIKDAEAFKKARDEFRAWFYSDGDSPYFKNNNWIIKEGLRYHMGIPPDVAIENYDPIITFATGFDWDDEALPYIRNVHKIPRARISELQKMSYEDYKNSDITGKLGLVLYINRGLKNKYLHGPLREFEAEIKKLKLDPGQQARVARFIRDIRGIPKNSDIDIENTLLDVANKVPIPIKKLIPGVGEDGKISNRHIELGMNAILSFIYSGGLGFRLSSAIKNSLQGPLNTPPGMTLYWWMTGVKEILTNPESRQLCWNYGIFHSVGVPGLYEDFQSPITKTLQQSLRLFTSVDHYWNRGPIYIGARRQFEWYLNKFQNDPNPIGKTTETIASKQMENIGRRWLDLAEKAKANDDLYKQHGNEVFAEKRDALVEMIKDEYGFVQQANSNWEYGTMGRPHIFATKGGKLAGTFMTWPTWYWGTYLPSLLHQDKFGLIRHMAKATLAVYFFNKVLHMNIRPWTGFGTLPIAPYGPLPQMIFKAIEWKQASLYGHEEWTKNARKDFLKSLMVGIPGMYAVTDWMKVFDEYHKETPYWDKRTGMLHTGHNHWKAWSDLAGVTNFYNDQKRMLEYIKNGEMDAANKIGRIYNMQKVYRRPDGAIVR